MRGHQVRWVFCLGKLQGIPEKYHRVQVTFDHHNGKRRYGATEAKVEEGGSAVFKTGAEGWDGCVSFDAHVHHHVVNSNEQRGEWANKDVILTLTASRGDTHIADMAKEDTVLATARLNLKDLVALDGAAARDSTLAIPWHPASDQTRGLTQEVKVRAEWEGEYLSRGREGNPSPVASEQPAGHRGILGSLFGHRDKSAAADAPAVQSDVARPPLEPAGPAAH